MPLGPRVGGACNHVIISPVAGTDNRKLHSLDPRPCEECGRVYSNLSNLRQHMKLIHYPTYVQCQICSKSFKTDLYLRRHTISCHDQKALKTSNFDSKITYQTRSSRSSLGMNTSLRETRKFSSTQNFVNTKHMANCVPLKYQLKSA